MQRKRSPQFRLTPGHINRQMQSYIRRLLQAIRLFSTSAEWHLISSFLCCLWPIQCLCAIALFGQRALGSPCQGSRRRREYRCLRRRLCNVCRSRWSSRLDTDSDLRATGSIRTHRLQPYRLRRSRGDSDRPLRMWRPAQSLVSG